MNKILTFIKQHKYLLTSLLINIILCFCLMSNCRGRDPVIKTEYVETHDTITVEKERIVEKTKIKYVNLTDTFFIKENDTVFVEVPIESRFYEDTIKTDSTEAHIRVDYTGAFTSIDSIYLDYKYNKEIQTIIKPAKKWGLGVTIGPTIGYGFTSNMQNGTIGHGPFIGVSCTVGLDYRIEFK